MSLIPLDLNIILGPYKFSLQATVDHEKCMQCGHYTCLCQLLWKESYCKSERGTQCDIINTLNSSIYIYIYTYIYTYIHTHTYIYIYIYMLLFKLIVGYPLPDRGGWEFIYPHGAGTFVYPINYRSRNRYRNLWGRQYISPWWPLDWFGYLHELCIEIWFKSRRLPGGVWHLSFVALNV